MTKRIKKLYGLILNKEHHRFRRDLPPQAAERFRHESLAPMERVTLRLTSVLAAETPVMLEGERIAFTRTVKEIPPVFTDEEWEHIRSEHFIHERGDVSNISPGYESIIKAGLLPLREKALAALPANEMFYRSAADSISGVLDLCERYRLLAKSQGNERTAKILARVPAGGAEHFDEALQMLRILHFTLWCEGEYHNTLGRFDQYMYPYLKKDFEDGYITEEEAMEWLEEFFLSLNKDSDLYPGVQQGDNGQSMVLGGVDRGGAPCFNKLSEMCLKAAKELKLIDPKINLRVNNETDVSIYRLGTELTAEGLGFPQYSNDDVVIPGLIEKGYSVEDARDYAVAACWEFIIPRWGMDIPNIGALSFPKIIDRCFFNGFIGADSFDSFLSQVEKAVAEECDEIIKSLGNLWMIPAPFMSLMMDDCFESGRDISLGAKYNNYGIHGTGLATAADSLAAIEKYAFIEASVSAEEYTDAVRNNFEGYDGLLHKLRYETPKLGEDEDAADRFAGFLLGAFAAALEGKTNERGGVYRAGTGSAMFYLWHARDIGASPDGRKAGEPFPCNYSPSLFARLDGPISVVKSFTKPDLKKNMNGGPLTLEFHSSLFDNPESIDKVARLVMYYVSRGGHQLQLNAVNRDRLLDAQRNPEMYRNLIVRVWGWSAYFIELHKDFQDHIIARTEFK